MENRLGPVGKQALLSLGKVVQEGKPRTACAAAQNNRDHCAGGTLELSLTLPAAGGGRGLGQELGQVLMFSVKAGLALVLSCSLLCSAGIHEDSWDPSALTPGSGSSFSHARLLPWDLAEPPRGVWGQF